MAVPQKPCASCGLPIPLPMEQEAHALNYATSESTVLTVRGRRESIMQPLISSYGKPKGGWYVNILINDIPQRITGNSALAVFNATKQALAKNGQKVSDLNIWYNLNLQWYARVQDKHKLTRMPDLLALASVSEGKTKLDRGARRYTPADWGFHAWNFMGAFLAKDDYKWGDFFSILELVQGMLNNDANPSIGCNECYIEFTKEVDLLRHTPKYTVKEARQWLVDFHNSVNKRINKPIFTYEAAAKKYLWT